MPATLRGGTRDLAPEEAAHLEILSPSLRVCSPCRWPDATLPTPSPPPGLPSHGRGNEPHIWDRCGSLLHGSMAW